MKTVLITGANKSIGFETARQLLQQGYYVYLGCRDKEKGSQAVSQLISEGLDQVEPIEIDVNNKESIKAAREVLGQKIKVLDVLINNAGISGTMDSALEVDITVLREVFDTNFFGVISVTQAFLELLKKSESPRISNITSGLGSLTLHNDPNWKYYNFKSASYGTSKAALNAYTIVLAYELKDLPFKVNVIDPGYTATDFNHHSGPGTIESAASFIIKHTLTDENGPTGKFFSNDIEDETGISPW